MDENHANGLVAAERQARIKRGESVLLLNNILFNAPAIFPSSPLIVRGTAMDTDALVENLLDDGPSNPIAQFSSEQRSSL